MKVWKGRKWEDIVDLRVKSTDVQTEAVSILKCCPNGITAPLAI